MAAAAELALAPPKAAPGPPNEDAAAPGPPKEAPPPPNEAHVVELEPPKPKGTWGLLATPAAELPPAPPQSTLATNMDEELLWGAAPVAFWPGDLVGLPVDAAPLAAAAYAP